MSEFARTWISSEEQLRALTESFQRASLTRKLAGSFEFPSHATHLQGLFMPWMRSPTLFRAVGVLTIVAGRVQFRSTPPRLFGWRIKNIDRAFAFDLPAEAVVAVTERPFESPFAKAFDMPLTRIQTSEQGVLADFLLCVGHPLSPPKMRARSLELRAALQRMSSGVVAPG